MQIQINSDKNIIAPENFITQVETKVEDGLFRFKDWIARVEVHLGDENAAKSGHKMGRLDKRCMIEVRPRGHQPISVTNHAEDLDQAIVGAIHKMNMSLSTIFDRLNEYNNKTIVTKLYNI